MLCKGHAPVFEVARIEDGGAGIRTGTFTTNLIFKKKKKKVGGK